MLDRLHHIIPPSEYIFNIFYSLARCQDFIYHSPPVLPDGTLARILNISESIHYIRFLRFKSHSLVHLHVKYLQFHCIQGTKPFINSVVLFNWEWTLFLFFTCFGLFQICLPHWLLFWFSQTLPVFVTCLFLTFLDLLLWLVIKLPHMDSTISEHSLHWVALLLKLSVLSQSIRTVFVTHLLALM